MSSSEDRTWPKSVRLRIEESDRTAPPKLKNRRLESGPVNGGTHTSGFDEILPTNSQNRLLSDMLQKAVVIPAGSSPAFGGAHQSYTKPRARQLFDSAEGVRTDTANTLLALPGGGVAFHTHAGGSTSGQAEGHDVRRRAFARALPQPFSPEADAVFSGAVMLASRPPAVVARAGADTTLLRDQSALSTFESDRDASKAVVNSGFKALPKSQQKAVRDTIQLTFNELNAGAPPDLRRELAADAPTSPRRSTAPLSSMSSEAHGGGYLAPKKSVPAAKPVADESPAAFGRRSSKPFRRERDY